jgi:SAM-dependent methyltransferase
VSIDQATHAQIVAEQRTLWGTEPRDWAELAERENLSLYEAILDQAGGRDDAPGGRPLAEVSHLDVGCGSGLLCQLSHERGAQITGVDVSPELLKIARERVPEGDFHDQDMSELPFGDGEFDLVTGVNAFQFAPDPAVAFEQAARVLAPGGSLIAAVFAEPERNQGTALHLAMKALIVEAEGAEDGYAPYALSSEQGLQAALSDAGLTPLRAAEVPVDWRYADTGTALRALLASAGGARAVRAAGRDRVIATLTPALEPFTGEDGVVTMHNLFRYVVAGKPR